HICYIAKSIGTPLQIIGTPLQIQVFQTPPWPQTASTNICETMSCSQELSEFKHGTVICCHLCNKSIREISLLLNIPRSFVSGTLTRWMQLGTTATQPQSARPRKMTERRSVHAEAHINKPPTVCRVN
ncbi:unnamed protein product, partial [Staurois parvus]